MVELRTAQKLFLDKAEQTRKKGNKKGLLIFATGLGKTLASLSDALKIAGKKGKILVLVHNHNLLYQLAKDFKLLNKKKKIGFLYKSKKEVNAEVLFANVMTLKQKRYLYFFKPNEFDYIIIDETHHVGAKSYKKVLNYFKPKFLLGMTATPNRTDQIDILPLYDNNIIMNVGSFEAINKKWLRPYKNIFLWDEWCDYNKVKSYRLKSGYFKYFNKDLGRAYFVPERDKAIVKWFKEKAKDRKGIGFCVSVNESIRMAKLFNDNGIKSITIWGGSKKGRTMNERKRNKILKDYGKGKYQMIFNCEIIGEGLHLPSVDVVLKLRPTSSAIKDNQHNGRGLFNIEGLKRNGNKYEQLLIMDLVGNYKNAYLNYIYQGKPRENKSGKKLDLRKIVELPIGCEVNFEERVIEEFSKQMEESGGRRTLVNAIQELKKIYGDKKPYRVILVKEHSWIYHALHRYHLLDEYCRKTKGRKLNDAIIELKKIYGDKKPYRSQLYNENHWIYSHLRKTKLLDEYCQPNKCGKQYGIGLLKKFKKIYGDKKPFRSELWQNNQVIYRFLSDNNLLDEHCQRDRTKLNTRGTLQELIKELKKIYGDKKPIRSQFHKEHPWMYLRFKKHRLLDKYCQDKQMGKGLKTNKNITITSKYKPKTILPKQIIKKKGIKKGRIGMKKVEYASKDDKKEIREKIISHMKDGDNVLLLESPDLSALKEIEKQGKKPKKIIIPNHLEFKKLEKAIRSYKTNLNIEIIKTSALQYLADNKEKFDFIWLDYCGGFSSYKRDLDFLFKQHLNNMKLILTYNLFDPLKGNNHSYLLNVTDYVLSKAGSMNVRLLKDIGYRYKKNMYNIGFNIKQK